MRGFCYRPLSPPKWSSGIFCLDGGPLRERVEAPAILYGWGNINQVSVRRNQVSHADSAGVGGGGAAVVQLRKMRYCRKSAERVGYWTSMIPTCIPYTQVPH